MAIMTLTDGTVIITIDNCKCGLTVGCELCKPYTYKTIPTPAIITIPQKYSQEAKDERE